MDQRKPFGIQLKKGSTKFFDVKERAILSFNNAGAVELLWGKDLYNSPGEIGEMKALNLPGDLKTLAKKVKQ